MTTSSRPTLAGRPRGLSPRPLAARGPRPATVLVVLLMSLVIGTVLGIAVFVVGQRVGGTGASAAGDGTSGGAAATGSPTSGAALTPVAVRAFDPQGDNTENDDQVPAAYDGNTGTAWYTLRYASARLGGLKQGVGLLVDLGTAHRVSSVQVQVTDPGATLQLLAGDGADLSALRPVTTVQDAATTVTLRPSATVDARYLAVWLTVLPAASDGHGGYKQGIAELAVRGS